MQKDNGWVFIFETVNGSIKMNLRHYGRLKTARAQEAANNRKLVCIRSA